MCVCVCVLKQQRLQHRGYYNICFQRAVHRTAECGVVCVCERMPHKFLNKYKSNWIRETRVMIARFSAVLLSLALHRRVRRRRPAGRCVRGAAKTDDAARAISDGHHYTLL